MSNLSDFLSGAGSVTPRVEQNEVDIATIATLLAPRPNMFTNGHFDVWEYPRDTSGGTKVNTMDRWVLRGSNDGWADTNRGLSSKSGDFTGKPFLTLAYDGVGGGNLLIGQRIEMHDLSVTGGDVTLTLQMATSYPDEINSCTFQVRTYFGYDISEYTEETITPFVFPTLSSDDVFEVSTTFKIPAPTSPPAGKKVNTLTVVFEATTQPSSPYSISFYRAKLERGSEFSGWNDDQTYEERLRQCQRYFCVIPSGAPVMNRANFWDSSRSDSAGWLVQEYPVPMAINTNKTGDIANYAPSVALTPTTSAGTSTLWNNPGHIPNSRMVVFTISNLTNISFASGETHMEAKGFNA